MCAGSRPATRPRTSYPAGRGGRHEARRGGMAGRQSARRSTCLDEATGKDVVRIADVEFPLDPTNAGQSSAWNGDDGEYWATYHREYERLLEVFDATLVEAGAVPPPTGSSRSVAARVPPLGRSRLAPRDGSVFALDLSGPMLRSRGRRQLARHPQRRVRSRRRPGAPLRP